MEHPFAAAQLSSWVMHSTTALPTKPNHLPSPTHLASGCPPPLETPSARLRPAPPAGRHVARSREKAASCAAQPGHPAHTPAGNAGTVPPGGGSSACVQKQLHRGRTPAGTQLGLLDHTAVLLDHTAALLPAGRQVASQPGAAAPAQRAGGCPNQACRQSRPPPRALPQAGHEPERLAAAGKSCAAVRLSGERAAGTRMWVGFKAHTSTHPPHQQAAPCSSSSASGRPAPKWPAAHPGGGRKHEVDPSR